MADQNLKNTVAAMMAENTGTHLLDSGGAYGRNWEKNRGKTVEDFEREPECWLEVNEYGDGEYECLRNINTYHFLAGDSSPLEIDDLCEEFARHYVPADAWDTSPDCPYYGVSAAATDWLRVRGFTSDPDAGPESFNTYNWESDLTQVLQGHFLMHDPHNTGTGETYLLLQIHGGCDVRGGYTDARLFKVSTFDSPIYAIVEDCMFGTDQSGGFSYRGEWINEEGTFVDESDAELQAFFKDIYENHDGVLHGTLCER